MAWIHSVLVVANVTATSDELLEALRERTRRGPARFTLLVPPTVAGRDGLAAARLQLERALERAHAAGLDAEGRIGDADPVVAVKEAWDPRTFDEIVVSTLPSQTSRWLQVDLPHRVERLIGEPVTHVVASEPRRKPRAAPAPEPERWGVLTPLRSLLWSRQEAPSTRSPRRQDAPPPR